MQYQAFQNALKDFVVFSLVDIRKIDPGFYGRRLVEWQQKGYITKLRRGFYMFANTNLSEEGLFLAANKLYAPSYVSLEMALSYYNLIPEGVYLVTSVTGKKTARFTTPIGQFFYRSFRPELFFGYNLISCGNMNYKLAEIEKAVLDYLYINPKSGSRADLQEWRFNGGEFLARANMDKFKLYAKMFKSPSLEKRVKQFISFIQK